MDGGFVIPPNYVRKHVTTSVYVTLGNLVLGGILCFCWFVCLFFGGPSRVSVMDVLGPLNDPLQQSPPEPVVVVVVVVRCSCCCCWRQSFQGPSLQNTGKFGQSISWPPRNFSCVRVQWGLSWPLITHLPLATVTHPWPHSLISWTLSLILWPLTHFLTTYSSFLC